MILTIIGVGRTTTLAKREVGESTQVQKKFFV